jgi:Flp pilus assembly protein TadB
MATEVEGMDVSEAENALVAGVLIALICYLFYKLVTLIPLVVGVSIAAASAAVILWLVWEVRRTINNDLAIEHTQDTRNGQSTL